ncbi:Electron transfer flavoprotein, alpha subunit [Desulfurella amilsii]|uniref:Electron transfer flavoprotein, alpha subunit n=1 Tax=Desulfurella amilsii TaxID=1562698 RepID=A0A1X4XUM9_9BACT|nr:electron transfer flavoprotein subunit alpha/FixB family protein [Desulfurella amilsii]OSS41245.1 Electron transfer flavoprotein, alpha subunit [Desulfurella amilsii]
MNVRNVLIISDDNQDRLSELNFVAKKFSSNIDAIIFTNKNEINIDLNRVYGINNLPVNSIDALNSMAAKYDLILTNGFAGACVGGILAYKLKACCIFGVNAIRYNDFIFLHSAYGDKTVIEYKPLCLPLVIVLKEKYFEQSPCEDQNKHVVEWIDVDNKVNLIKEEVVEKKVELDKAKFVVGGGRGIGSKEGFEILRQLANKLGGIVGSSRAAVDNGWISHQYQIGQSGAMLSANLYFAFGISGATQHLSGIKNVKCVVAINTDEEAPIFKRARYNIVADWKSFAMALLNQLEVANG